MKKVFGTLLLTLFGLSIGLLLMEIVVSLFFPGPLGPRFAIDSGFGIRANKPDVEIRHFVPNEYDIIITNNNDGLRGTKDYSIDKPENLYRIALLGDSFIWGAGVNDHEVVSTVMEEKLNSQNPDTNSVYEVLNFGVSGFGQAEELLTYRNKARPYVPDEVIIFYFNNDIGNNQVPGLFYLNEEGELQATGNSYLPAIKAREMLHAFGPTNWIMTHSQAWNLIRNRLSSLIHKLKLKKKGLKSYTQPSDKGIALTISLLGTLISESREDGAKVTVVTIPDRSIKSNFPLSEASVNEAGADFIDGREIFDSNHYYKFDGHWRPSGHDLIADILARRTLTNR